MAAMDDPPFGYGNFPAPQIVVQRQGIIPCARCAFFVKDDGSRLGTCHRYPPKPEGRWTATGVDSDCGCGEGLLREEAAPLPPEVR